MCQHTDPGMTHKHRDLIHSGRVATGVEAKERSIYKKPDFIQQVHGSWGRTRLGMPKTICAPDSSSLKPGSGATEGVLDKGVFG